MALLDPKGAPHDIVQAIKRALRQKPGEGKLASLIVPVFLQPGEKPEDMFTSGSYRPGVRTLEGLRAHDEEVIEPFPTWHPHWPGLWCPSGPRSWRGILARAPQPAEDSGDHLLAAHVPIRARLEKAHY